MKNKRILNIMNTPPQYIKIYTKSLPLPCAVQTWCNLIVNCALILYNFTVILIPAISILNVLPFICEETHPMSVENDRANCGWWMVMGRDMPAEHPLLRVTSGVYPRLCTALSGDTVSRCWQCLLCAQHLSCKSLSSEVSQQWPVSQCSYLHWARAPYLHSSLLQSLVGPDSRGYRQQR